MSYSVNTNIKHVNCFFDDIENMMGRKYWIEVFGLEFPAPDENLESNATFRSINTVYETNIKAWMFYWFIWNFIAINVL